MPCIEKYFIHGEKLVEFVRREMGLPESCNHESYNDYLIETIQRSLKSDSLKRLFKNRIIIIHE